MNTAIGAFNTNNFTTDLAKPSFASMIVRLMPNGTAPLFALTAQLESETAVATEHGFFTKTMVFPETTTTAAITTATQATISGNTDQMLVGMILRNNTTTETMIVNAVGANSITVTRNVGATTFSAIALGEVLVQIGNAFEESSTRPLSMNILPVRITNLTQIFRNTWSISGTARAVQVIAGDGTESENRRDCAGFHAQAIETSLIFGVKSQSSRNGQPFRTMDGLLSIIGQSANYPPVYAGGTNVFTANATTNFSELEAFLDKVADQATDPTTANERVLFVGGTAMKVINQIGRLNGEYNLVDGQTNFGLRFKTLTMTRVTFRLIEHPIFNTNTVWSRMALAVDLSTFKTAYLGDRKTESKMFNAMGSAAADDGIDAVGGTLTTEMTCVVKNPPANAVISGLTAGAVG